jgi:hypothetical protein
MSWWYTNIIQNPITRTPQRGQIITPQSVNMTNHNFYKNHFLSFSNLLRSTLFIELPIHEQIKTFITFLFLVHITYSYIKHLKNFNFTSLNYILPFYLSKWQGFIPQFHNTNPMSMSVWGKIPYLSRFSSKHNTSLNSQLLTVSLAPEFASTIRWLTKVESTFYDSKYIETEDRFNKIVVIKRDSGALK